jgi:hypothetical protein
MTTTIAKPRRWSSVRDVVMRGLLDRISGAGIWTPRQVVAEHQRPCPFIGRYLEAAMVWMSSVTTIYQACGRP